MQMIQAAMSIQFQLTPSRRATDYEDKVDNQLKISTHALTEGD